MSLRNLAATGIATLMAVGSLGLLTADRLDGLSLDMLFWLRDAAFGRRHELESSPTVVIAIDEETYRQPVFKDLPGAMWTPQLAKVLEAALAGGAQVVGFDIIMPISMEKHIPGFDHDFLLALSAASADGKVVLSKVQHRQKPISPHPAYSFAVGHQQNIRAANLYEDADGIIRRVPVIFRSEDLQAGGRTDPSFAVEVAARTLGVRPMVTPDGLVRLGSYTIPGSETGGMLVNFDGSQQIPTYSLADLYACAEEGRSDYFQEHFAGKAVLIGATLDVEDRRLTSKRLIPSPDGAGLAARCRLPVPEGFYDSARARDTIPGVFIHAQAVNDLLRRDVLFEPGRLWRFLLDFTMIFGAGWMTMSWPPLRAGILLLVGAGACTAIATLLFQFGFAFPLLAPMFGSGLAYAWLLGYRFAVTDRRSRHLSQTFGYYLSPLVIDRMIAAGHQPEVGGEVRRLTVLFSDIEGFTGIAEGYSPPELVRFLNAYLAEMTDIVESHGGFVDKYVGDGIVAVFGAPIEEPAHALQATKAALACQIRMARAGALPNTVGNRPVRTRIGINTGDMLVGNIGSRRRLNYTVMGDAVNLAARLEAANKVYGTSILVSEATMGGCGSSIAFREVDHVRVAGRHGPVRIFEPIALADTLRPEDKAFVQLFASAMHDFRARRFAAAESAFRAMATSDGVSATFARRSAELGASPPSGDWDAIYDLDHK